MAELKESRANLVAERLSKYGGIVFLCLFLLPVIAIPIWVGDAEKLAALIEEYLAIGMLVSLAVLLFTGYPVAFILGGLSIVFGFLGWMMGMYQIIEFFNFVPRIWIGAAENLVLVAVPAFIFMGIMMERSGVAHRMLYACQVLLRKVAGALALSITVMGTVLAAMTGIIGASVTMMTAMALPLMLRQGYNHGLACGAIAASGCLGILIPPSIMLIIMADLLSISVGSLFMAALGPGLCLAALYLTYIYLIAKLRPSVAPSLPEELLQIPKGDMTPLILRGFLPPVFLIALIKCSILFGWATPSEGGAVGAFGAIVLAGVYGSLKWPLLRDVCHASANTIAMVFFIILAATCYAYVFRSLGGEFVVEDLIREANLGTWGLLFLIMFIVFILGFFLDWLEITLIILPIFAPMVATFDFGDHIAKADALYWFTVLLAINLQTSFLTPPFGYALFYLKGIAPAEVTILSIYKGIIPFVILQLIGLTAVLIFPKISTWLPNLVYGG